MLGSITVLLGPEEGLKNDLIETESKVLREKYPLLDEKIVYAFEYTDKDFFSDMMMPSLFTTNTLLIIKEFTKPKQALVNAIIEYSKNPTEGNHLIILSNETAYAFPKSLLDKVPKSDQKVFYELNQSKKVDYVKNFFNKEGFTITSDAISLLLSLVDNNTAEIKAYSSQLTNYFHLIEDKNIINDSDISTYLSHTKREDGTSLFSYIAKADTERAIASIKNILLYDPRGVVGIIATLVRQFRILAAYLEVVPNTYSADDAFKNAKAINPTILSKTPTVSRIFTEQNVIKEAARNYTLKDANNIIKLLDEVDVTSRELTGEMLTYYLELLVISIIENKGKKTKLMLERELMDNSFSNL